jgi:hypothetical protein
LVHLSNAFLNISISSFLAWMASSRANWLALKIDRAFGATNFTRVPSHITGHVQIPPGKRASLHGGEASTSVETPQCFGQTAWQILGHHKVLARTDLGDSKVSRAFIQMIGSIPNLGKEVYGATEGIRGRALRERRTHPATPHLLPDALFAPPRPERAGSSNWWSYCGACGADAGLPP